MYHDINCIAEGEKTKSFVFSGWKRLSLDDKEFIKSITECIAQNILYNNILNSYLRLSKNLRFSFILMENSAR